MKTVEEMKDISRKAGMNKSLMKVSGSKTSIHITFLQIEGIFG